MKESKSQTRSVSSLDAETTRRPSSDTAKLNTLEICPLKVPKHFPEASCHIRINPSREPETANSRSLCVTATLLTREECPSNSCKNLPENTSQSLIVPSLDAD